MIVEFFGSHVEHGTCDVATSAGELPCAQLEVGDGLRLGAVTDENHFRLEAVGDVDVELRREGVRGIGVQAFDDQDVGILAGIHAQRDDVFEDVGALVRGNAFGDGVQRD